MRTRFALVVVTALVAVAMLAVPGIAWAAVTPLTVTKTAPGGGAKGVALKANVMAYFKHDMRASTVTSATFKIRKLGTTTWLGATRSVNNAVSPTSTNGASQSVATLNPSADLAPGTTYEVVVVGGRSGVKAVNGKALGTNKRWTFTTVATPPNTTIDSGPTGTVSSGSAGFSFSSSKAGSTFQCSLDGGAFGACASPKNYTNLPDGQHTFSVRATDAAGNTDASPAVRTWTVDTTAPGVGSVTPADGAAGVDVTGNATATFSEPMNASTITSSSFTLTKQGVTTPIGASVSYDDVTRKATLTPSTSLEEGAAYTATVKGGASGAKDRAGNALAADRTWSFATPAVPPETTILSGGAEWTFSTVMRFEFSSSTPNSTFECSLDGAPFGACTSPKDYTNLSEGNHTFLVRSTDAAGNTDATPASSTWLVKDGTPPETRITSGPSNPSSSSASFSFSSSEPNSTFECSLDGAPFGACTSPKDYTGLLDGQHTFSVRAKDAAGNTDATPASTAWMVETVAPTINSVSPINTATIVAQSTNVTATFSESMNPSSISGQTFMLTEQGSTNLVAAAVSYDDSTKKATLDPNSGLASNTTYIATVKGASSGVKDRAGNTLAQDHSWTFTTRPVEVTPSPLDFTPGTSACNTTITKTVTITNTSASQVDLFPSVTNVHYSVASDVLHIASGESLGLSLSWTAPNSGFRVRDPGRLEVKDAAGTTIAAGDLTAFINCGIEG